MPTRRLSLKGGWIGGPTSIGEGTSAMEDAGPKGGGLRDPTSVGEANEAFFIRVWKPLPADAF